MMPIEMIIVIKFNTSSQVEGLIDRIKQANAALKKSLETVNSVVTVINTVDSLLSTADSLLKTALLFASLA